MSDDFKPGTAILPPHLAKLREDNPIAEGIRRYLSDGVLPDIVFDDLIKLDLRMGQVKMVDRVPKSDKLIRMGVDFGAGVGMRQIVAGVGKTFKPEELFNGVFLFIINLPPRKLMGIESHGMLFATGPDSEALSLLQPFGMEPVPGSKVG